MFRPSLSKPPDALTKHYQPFTFNSFWLRLKGTYCCLQWSCYTGLYLNISCRQLLARFGTTVVTQSHQSICL